MFDAVKPVDMTQIRAARERITGLSMMTPLLACDGAPPGKSMRLKLENLQPTGSFKVRPIANAVLSRTRTQLERGLYTSSSGNSALGVAWMARRLGVSATAIVPANAPEAKLEKLRRLGARIQVLSNDAWWRAIRTGTLADQDGVYIDAVRDPASLAGDATIGVEILEQWPDVEAILIPFGGGGLACGIACAIRALQPRVKIIACELSSAHPLQAAFAAGAPTSTAADAGFVSGVGYGSLLPEMWPLARGMIDEIITVPLTQVAQTIRALTAGNRVVAEGAGAISVAAALSGQYAETRVCAVVSGGNIDNEMLATILRGQMP